MNMKKTMAAIAAASVAVSAMATTVNALDDGSVHYSLVKDVKYTKVAEGTLTLQTIVTGGTSGATEDVLNPIGDIVVTDNLPLANGYGKVLVNINGRYDNGESFNVNVTADNSASQYYYKDAIAVNGDGSGFTLDLEKVGGFRAAAVQRFVVTVSNITHTYQDWQRSTVNGTLTPGAGTFTAGTTGINITDVFTTAGGFSLASHPGTTMTQFSQRTLDVKTLHYPMPTSTNTTTAYLGTINGIDNAYTGTRGELMNWLTYCGYRNHYAVINDIIANYDDVTFKFNTAAADVILGVPDYQNPDGGPEGAFGVKGYGDFAAYRSDNNEAPESRDSRYGSDARMNHNLEGAYDDFGHWNHDYATDVYKNFNQHIYNLWGDDAAKDSNVFGYNPYSYVNNVGNLFSGSLQINRGFTMTLNDVNRFEYGVNSLSFNWDDVLTDANDGTRNTSLTVIQTMQLATSDLWFWDSLDIVFANTGADLAEEVDSDAGLEEGDEVLEDDGGEIIDDAIIDDVVIDDLPVEEPPVVIDAPVVANPQTGNSPIALAVIPVALAAAAIIAKKRG